jgi:hypothetical protein
MQGCKKDVTERKKFAETYRNVTTAYYTEFNNKGSYF